MGLDSSGQPIVAILTMPTAEHLVAVRQSLFQVLERSKAMALSIEKSSARLEGMGDRLPALQAAVKPLHAQSMLANTLGHELDKAIKPTEAVLKTFDILRSIEKVINGDPRDDMPTYLASISQLEEAAQYLSSNCSVAVDSIAEAKEFLGKSKTFADSYRLHRLNERLASIRGDMTIQRGRGWDMGLLAAALSKLEVEFKRLLQESSEPFVLSDFKDDSVEGMAPSLPTLLPAPATHTLQILVERMSAHRSIDNILNCYKQSRTATIQQSLDTLQPDFLRISTSEAMDKLDWVELDDLIDRWTHQIDISCKILFKSERRLCSRVFDKLEKEKWIRLWGKLAVGEFGPFLLFGEMVARSKTAPEKLFRLLDMYETIENLLPHVLEVFEGSDSGCGEIRVRSRELLKKIAGMAGETVVEFCTFIEFESGDLPPDGNRSKKCSYVVNYTIYLVRDVYGPIMAKIARVERCWQADKQTGNVDDGWWLSLVVTKIMQSLEKHILKQEKGYKDRALANIFMLNSFGYMLSRAKTSSLGPLLGESWMREMKVKVVKHMVEYQKESWSKCLSYLHCEGLSLSSSGKAAIKEARLRLEQFTSAFEENCHRHSKWIVQPDLQNEILLAVTLVVVPAYRGFLQSYRPLLEHGGNGFKYVKLSPEDVETKLDGLFGDSTGRNGNNASRHQLPTSV